MTPMRFIGRYVEFADLNPEQVLAKPYTKAMPLPRFARFRFRRHSLFLRT